MSVLLATAGSADAYAATFEVVLASFGGTEMSIMLSGPIVDGMLLDSVQHCRNL